MRPLRFAVPALVLALAGCTGDGAKDDVAEVPFAAAAEGGKADSPHHPIDGGVLKIGRSESGRFDAGGGWFSHELYLTAGEVEVLASGLEEDGVTAQDTILYLFGPERDDGSYPRRPLAFNDDDGAALSSRLRAAVPSDGTYRVVVSTYANWLAWPFNVSRGTFTVLVECPRAGAAPGVEVCGPTAAPEGGACWSEADCVNGNRCEGEIVCPPDALCLYARPGVCVADYAWVTLAPRQCGLNPWSGVEGAASGDELDSVATWLAAQGVAADQLGFLRPSEPTLVCLACQCPRGDTLLVKAPAADAERLVAEHGFARVAEGTLASVAPVQCGGNPWQTEDASADEHEQVVSWARSEGATPLSLVGFVRPVEPALTCSACSCARGDLLVAGGATETIRDTLSRLGFVDVYRP